MRGAEGPGCSLMRFHVTPPPSLSLSLGQDYICRVGRTARAGRAGRAITFVTQYVFLVCVCVWRNFFLVLQVWCGVIPEDWAADWQEAATVSNSRRGGHGADGESERSTEICQNGERGNVHIDVVFVVILFLLFLLGNSEHWWTQATCRWWWWWWGRGG